jgi:hypothetical protein
MYEISTFPKDSIVTPTPFEPLKIVRVQYDLNLTRGCPRFYYLAPFTVFDSFSHPFLPCQCLFTCCVVYFLCCVLVVILKMADILKILKTQNCSSNGDLSLCQILCLYHYLFRSYQHYETWWSYRYMFLVDPKVFRFVVNGVKAIFLGVQRGWGLL